MGSPVVRGVQQELAASNAPGLQASSSLTKASQKDQYEARNPYVSNGGGFGTLNPNAIAGLAGNYDDGAMLPGAHQWATLGKPLSAIGTFNPNAIPDLANNYPETLERAATGATPITGKSGRPMDYEPIPFPLPAFPGGAGSVPGPGGSGTGNLYPAGGTPAIAPAVSPSASPSAAALEESQLGMNLFARAAGGMNPVEYASAGPNNVNFAPFDIGAGKPGSYDMFRPVAPVAR
jgi:hypothetical protein